MNNKGFTKIALIMTMAVMMAFSVTACGNRQNTDSGQQVPNPEEVSEQTEDQEDQAQALAEEAQETVEQAESEVHAVEDSIQNEVLADFTGKMDLAGSWQDEISKRATMDVTANEDGSYDIVSNWAGSATEKAVWQIHGTYDEVSGMLSYEDGRYSIHTWDENDNETVSDEEVTKGAFMKEGEKLRWQDSKNSEDGVFVKM